MGYLENTVKGFSEVPEHIGLYFKNTIKWRKGYPENTVKGFSEVPENYLSHAAPCKM
jgi:hypothetical protein